MVIAASDQVPETDSPSSLMEIQANAQGISFLFQWLLEPRKDGPWIALDPTLQAPTANDVEAYLARASFPGMNPSWDYRTGIARSQPSRRALRPGGISRSSTATFRSRRTLRSQSSNRLEQNLDNNPPSQSEIRESDLTSEVPPELIPDGTIDPALLAPAFNVDQPPQTTTDLPPTDFPPTATGNSAPNHPRSISPPDQTGSGLNPSPTPLTPSDGPEMEDDTVEAMIREFLNVDEDGARARG